MSFRIPLATRLQIACCVMIGCVTFSSAALAQNDEPVACAQTAHRLSMPIGDSVVILCPADCKGPPIWGTDIYTDDSSMCVAAIHAGVYDGSAPARVRVTLRPGQKRYTAQKRHGVASRRWGYWKRSFSVAAPRAKTTPHGASGSGDSKAPPAPSKAQALDAPASVSSSSQPSPTSAAPTTTAARGIQSRQRAVDCAFRGDEVDAQSGDTRTVTCPTHCGKVPIWGSNPYTGDSSVCASAIHAGVISDTDGGSVTIRIGGTVRNLPASTRHGITSRTWMYWPKSFTVEGAAAAPSP